MGLFALVYEGLNKIIYFTNVIHAIFGKIGTS